MDSDAIIMLVCIIGMFLVGVFRGFMVERPIEIQDIKLENSGYYITINNKIYYEEVEKDD